MIRKLLCLLAIIAMLVPPAAQGTQETGFSIDLSDWIQKSAYREYVEMMVDYHLRTNESVRNALAGGFSAVFLFDGCSDNMNNPALNDLSYYRVSGICLALKLDQQGNVAVKYFNGNCSTIPDRPLAYGAWAFQDVGEVGPATVCDGTYQIYSVRHKGKYEALHVRTEYTDATVEAVYLTPDGGFVNKRANEINVHTRNGNHILQKSMWSAGCPLVGGGKFWEYRSLIRATYYQTYPYFELDNYVGSLTIDRTMLRSEMYTLYENPDAVDMLLANSRNIQPEMYLRKCEEISALEKPRQQKTARAAQLMSLPCGNATDARSRCIAELEPGTRVSVLGVWENPQGNRWLKVSCQDQTGYLYEPYTKDLNPVEWLLDTIFG